MGGNSQVADADERRTAAQGEPVDGGDKDRGMLPDGDQHFNPIRTGIGRGRCLGVRPCFLEIYPRTKAVTATGQHNRSAFGAKGSQRGKKITTRGAVQGILLFSTIEAYDGITLTLFDGHEGRHLAPLIIWLALLLKRDATLDAVRAVTKKPECELLGLDCG